MHRLIVIFSLFATMTISSSALESNSTGTESAPVIVEAATSADNGWSLTDVKNAVEKALGVRELIVKEVSKNDDPSWVEQTRYLDPEDSLWWISHEGYQTYVSVAGTRERIHTIQITTAVVNLDSAHGETYGEFIGALFASLLPDWEGAKDWPITSLEMSWAISAEGMEKGVRREQADVYEAYLDKFVQTAMVGKVELSTAGVVPDIIYYRLSLMPECNLRAHSDDMFQRFVC